MYRFSKWSLAILHYRIPFLISPVVSRLAKPSSFSCHVVVASLNQAKHTLQKVEDYKILPI